MVVPHYSNKGQLQMIETILVLFIFILILVFGLYFYYQYSFSNIQQTSFELSEAEANALVSSITSLPELSCTNQKNCIDIIKLINFKSVYNQNKAYYASFFKNKKILVEQIYPESTQNLCTFQPIFPIQCNSIILHQPVEKPNKYILSLPISLYYPNLDKYSLGKVVLEVYK